MEGKAYGPYRCIDISVILNDTNLLAGLQEAIEQRNANSGIILRVACPQEASSDDAAHVGGTGEGGEEEDSVNEAQATKAQAIPLLLSEYNRLPDGSFEDQETGLSVRINPFNLVSNHRFLACSQLIHAYASRR